MTAATLAPNPFPGPAAPGVPVGLEAAARARRQATAVAAVGAVVPTILAAQGMASLATDVLGFSLLVAVALAGFLELALVSSALLARAAALAGRPGGADAVAVWVVSATSGLLAGVHELVDTTATGSTWSTDPGAFLAAGVRVVAPLVAAWLWERVLQAARAEQAERTLAEVRRDRRFLEVGRRALAVRRLESAGRAPWRVRRARRRLDRVHLAALRSVPPAAELGGVLAAVGQVDVLPDATRPTTTPSDTRATGATAPSVTPSATPGASSGTGAGGGTRAGVTSATSATGDAAAGDIGASVVGGEVRVRAFAADGTRPGTRVSVPVPGTRPGGTRPRGTGVTATLPPGAIPGAAGSGDTGSDLHSDIRSAIAADTATAGDTADGTGSDTGAHDGAGVTGPVLGASATTGQRARVARAMAQQGADLDVICAMVGRSRRTVFRYLAGEDTDTPATGLLAVTPTTGDTTTPVPAPAR